MFPNNTYIFNERWKWTNISELLYAPNSSAALGGFLSAPFTVATTEQGLSGYFFNPACIWDETSPVMLSWQVANASSLINGSATIQQYSEPASIGSLDNLVLRETLLNSTNSLLDINETPTIVSNATLYGFDGPPGSFPFGRLAYLSGNGTMNLYHQLNESILIEQVQDVSLGSDGWGNPIFIAIPTAWAMSASRPVAQWLSLMLQLA